MDESVGSLRTASDFLSVMAGRKPAFLLGLDVGTSGVRAALFDERGNEIDGAEARSTRRAAPLSSFGELDPDLIVARVVETIDDLFSLAPLPNGHITFISLSCFWHSLLGLDKTDWPTTPLLTWADTRASGSIQQLRTSFDEAAMHQRTGARFHPSYWPAKLHWLKEDKPDVCATTTRWLGFSEYLGLKLFDDTEASVSMASATGLFNQRNCDWDQEFIKQLDISYERLPRIRQGVGPRLSRQFAHRWPALADAQLMSTLGDGAANNVGGGCCTKDHIALMVGTSGAMRVVFRGTPPDLLPGGLWCYRVDRERVVVGGALSDGGGLYRWLLDSLAIGGEGPDLEKDLAALDADSHGLTVLPFWSGERSVGWSTNAKGAILGLTQATKPVEIVRAAMEGVAYRFAMIARDLEPMTTGANVIATGNALRASGVWRQIMADVLGRPVKFGGPSEASLRGAALLALEAVGKIGNIEELQVNTDEVVEPDTSRHVRYEKALERQQDFYQRVIANE